MTFGGEWLAMAVGVLETGARTSGARSDGCRCISDSSVDSFNKAVGPLEQQVMSAARRFAGLGLRVNRELDLIEPIDTVMRSPRTSGNMQPDPAGDETGRDAP
jgi:hypothetical protein